MFGDQALHKLGPFLFVGTDALAQEQLTNLTDTPRFAISNLQNLALFDQWAPCKNLELVYSGSDTWDHMLQQGIQLLERFVQDGRVQIRQPLSHQQVRFTRTLNSGNSFVAFVDAVGELDNTPCVLEWKTSSARYQIGRAHV